MNTHIDIESTDTINAQYEFTGDSQNHLSGECVTLGSFRCLPVIGVARCADRGKLHSRCARVSVAL